jgi:uncharacterized protein YaeQ
MYVILFNLNYSLNLNSNIIYDLSSQDTASFNPLFLDIERGTPNEVREKWECMDCDSMQIYTINNDLHPTKPALTHDSWRLLVNLYSFKDQDQVVFE